MEAVPDLEEYLRTAPIVHATQLPGGGGHKHKQLIVLDGGLGVVAKLAEGEDGDAPRKIRAEVAAWHLARELGWPELVPTTTLRTVRSIFTGNDAQASVQVAWPFFLLAGEHSLTPEQCPDDDVWKVAIFDALSGNNDRNATNWGFIKELSRVKLIDHGHAFNQQMPVSPFVDAKRGQAIPAESLDRVRAFVAAAPGSALRPLLDANEVDAIVERARSFADSSTFSL